jgi:hypothetical protein
MCFDYSTIVAVWQSAILIMIMCGRVRVSLVLEIKFETDRIKQCESGTDFDQYYYRVFFIFSSTTPSVSYCQKKKKLTLLRKVKCNNLKYDFLCFSVNKFHRKM